MSLIQIGEIVDCLNNQPVTFLVPAGSGTYDTDGTFIPAGSDVQIDNVQADIQPVGRFRNQVPEGTRLSDAVEVFVADPTFIDTINETTTTPEYKMVYRGTIWECADVPEDWRENGYINGLFVNTKVVFS